MPRSRKDETQDAGQVGDEGPEIDQEALVEGARVGGQERGIEHTAEGQLGKGREGQQGGQVQRRQAPGHGSSLGGQYSGISPGPRTSWSRL